MASCWIPPEWRPARGLLRIGSLSFSVSSLAEPLTIEPATTGRTVFVVARGRQVQVFRDFGEFSERVANLLASGAAMLTLTARGPFDEATTTVEANYVAVSFRQQ